MAKYTLYAKKVYYYRKEINAERLFEPSGEEFYITSIEESDDE